MSALEEVHIARLNVVSQLERPLAQGSPESILGVL
jgi:hypothetical protein